MKALKTLNPYIFKQKKNLILGSFFILLGNLLSIFALFYVGKSLNSISENQMNESTLSHLFFYASMFIGMNILSGIFTFFQRQTIIVASREIEFEIRKNIYAHYQKLSLSFYKQNKIGDLMNRISEDVSNVRMYLGPGIMYNINLVILLTIILSVMIYLDPILTFFSLLPLPFLSFIIFKISTKINKKSKLVQQSQSDLSSFVQDSFSGIRVVKAYNKEKYISENYQNKATNYKNLSLSLVGTEAYFFSLMIFFIGLSNIFIIYIGGKRYYDSAIDVGTLGMFFIFINKLIWPFTSLGWVSSLIQKAEASMTRINEFLHTDGENLQETNSEFHFNKKIEFKNVSYIYQNTGIEALKNISFTIEKGKSLAIMGNMGSGKTTIGLLIAGILKPTSGEIFIDEVPLEKINIKKLRDSIGYVPQESFLFSESIYNNIAFGLDEANQDLVENYARKAEIHSNILEFNEKYETKVGERGVTLSGGQKQRVSIARALIKDTDIIIFDDSLSALDTETEEAILLNIKKDFANKTSIIITHRISTTKKVDKILILNNGEIAEIGTNEELFKKDGYYKNLYDKQLSENIKIF